MVAHLKCTKYTHILKQLRISGFFLLRNLTENHLFIVVTY